MTKRDREFCHFPYTGMECDVLEATAKRILDAFLAEIERVPSIPSLFISGRRYAQWIRKSPLYFKYLAMLMAKPDEPNERELRKIFLIHAGLAEMYKSAQASVWETVYRKTAKKRGLAYESAVAACTEVSLRLLQGELRKNVLPEVAGKFEITQRTLERLLRERRECQKLERGLRVESARASRRNFSRSGTSV